MWTLLIICMNTSMSLEYIWNIYIRIYSSDMRVVCCDTIFKYVLQNNDVNNQLILTLWCVAKMHLCAKYFLTTLWVIFMNHGWAMFNVFLLFRDPTVSDRARPAAQVFQHWFCVEAAFLSSLSPSPVSSESTITLACLLILSELIFSQPWSNILPWALPSN